MTMAEILGIEQEIASQWIFILLKHWVYIELLQMK